MMKRQLIRLGMGFVAFTGCALSQASVAYNNFGIDDEVNSSQGEAILGNAWQPTYSQQSAAYQFESLASGTVNKLVLGVFHFHSRMQGIDPTTNEVKVSLFADSGDDKLGSLIKSWILADMPEFLQSVTPSVLTDNSGSAVMNAGSKYWLLVEASATDSGASWNFNTLLIDGPEANSFDAFGNPSPTYSYTTGRQGAFRVEVSMVPEPLSLVLGLPLVLFFGKGRRNR